MRCLLFQKPPQGGGIQQIYSLEFPAVEHGIVIEHAGQALGLCQGFHRDQGERDAYRDASSTLWRI